MYLCIHFLYSRDQEVGTNGTRQDRVEIATSASRNEVSRTSVSLVDQAEQADNEEELQCKLSQNAFVKIMLF